LRTLEGHTGQVSAVAISSDGRRAVSGSYECTLRVWDVESGQRSSALKGRTDAVQTIDVTPDERSAVSGSDVRALRLWDVESGQSLRTLEGHIRKLTRLPHYFPNIQRVFIAKCLRIFKAVESLELNPTHLLSKPVGSSLVFGEPAVRFHLIVEVPVH
jgi:WD40 repeat protein